MLNFVFDPFPVLVTERLELRNIEPADAEALLRLRSDPKVMEFMDRPLMNSLEETAQLITNIRSSAEKNEAITWGLSIKGKPELIGTIGFWKIIKEHHRAEIGYFLHTAHWGQGLMQEALKPVLEYGFRTMRLHSVEANVNPANAASIRFLVKNGFIREAYYKENYHFNGQFLDSAIYSLLGKNFIQKTK